MITSLRSGDATGVYVVHQTPQNRLGEYFCDNETNRLFVYLRANAGIAKGTPVVSMGASVLVTGLQAAAVGSRVLKFAGVNLNTTFPRVPAQPRESEYMIVGISGTDVSGIVYAHTQTEMDVSWDTDNGLLGTALTADWDLAVSVPWLVHAASTSLPGVVGIAQRTLEAGDFFWALVEGVGKILLGADATAGASLSILTNQPIAYTLRPQVADELVDCVAAAPVRIGIPPFERIPNLQSYQHPSATA